MARRIGIDFDNTIVDYNALFAVCGVEAGLLQTDFRGGKTAVRDTISLLDNGNWKWTQLQARVYGLEILRATPFAGFREFVDRAVDRGAELFIVSQKSRYPAANPGGVDLREAAFEWLLEHGFIEPGGSFAVDRVFFESDRSEKLARIARIGCTDFIDDLAEVLEDPAFPAHVRRYHFGGSPAQSTAGFVCWSAISDAIFQDS